MANKVLFNLVVCQPLADVKRHGGGIYGEIVFRRIVERGFPIACFYDSRKWINPDVMKLISENDIDLYDVSKRDIQSVISENGFKLLYSPIFQGLDTVRGCTIVTTIHGLRALETPLDSYQLKYLLNYKERIKYHIRKFFPLYWEGKMRNYYSSVCLKENIRFVTVSYHSRASFYVHFPDILRNTNIPVFYSPSTVSEYRVDKKKYCEKYYLLVSANRWDKNNLRAFVAFDELFAAGYLSGVKLKITGANNKSEFRYRFKNPDRFEFLGYVSSDELQQLYHDAYSFVYPSLNEGFGYPPLEAMSYGVPVIASSYSSIPEVCGDAAMYFNPIDVQEIKNRIYQMNEKDVHDSYALKGRERYAMVAQKQESDLDKLIDYIYSFEK